MHISLCGYILRLLGHNLSLILLLISSGHFLYLISSFWSSLMTLNWIPHPPGTLKINVHATSFDTPMPIGNSNGIEVVLRTSMAIWYAGTIPNLTPLTAQLWVIQVGLRRGFIEGATDIILETDNLQAFGAVQYAYMHQHPQLDDLIHQIITRIRDPNWSCSFKFVYPDRNRAAEYTSLLGGELFCRLYIFSEPIGRLAEILDLDLGLGPQAPQLLEAAMVEEEWEAFEEILADGGGALAENILVNLNIHVPGDELQLHDVVFEEELEDDEDDDLFDLF